MISSDTIHFQTDQFNTTEIGEHFINDCCFGEDLMEWIRDRNKEIGFEVKFDGQEDWGWYIACIFDNRQYTICCGYRPDDKTWLVFVNKHRSLKEMLFGKAKIADDDPLLHKLFQFLKTSPFQNVRLEKEP